MQGFVGTESNPRLETRVTFYVSNFSGTRHVGISFGSGGSIEGDPLRLENFSDNPLNRTKNGILEEHIFRKFSQNLLRKCLSYQKGLITSIVGLKR